MKSLKRTPIAIGIIALLFFLNAMGTGQNRLIPGGLMHVAKAASTCCSVYTVQNLSSTEARYLHDFYDTSRAMHYYMEDTLQGGASKTYYLRELTCVPDGFIGSLTISSNQRLSGQVIGLECGEIKGEYFTNASLSGSPALTRYDASIDFNWDNGSPHPSIPSDYFSVRWTTTLNATAGNYTFHTCTDDGVRLWVDSTLIINQWREMPPIDYYATVYLSAGEHTITMEYYDWQWGAVAQLSWTAPTTPAATPTPTPPPAGTPPPQTPVWTGRYFSNSSLSGSPTLTREDANINFNWDNGSPHPSIPSDNFSVRWTTTLNATAGNYTFHTRTDDGVRLYVDGRLIINQWQNMPPTDFYATVYLSAGEHIITMEYYDWQWGAVAQLSWNAPSSPAPIPTPPTQTSAWMGRYFNNSSLSGSPTLTREDANINFNWGEGSPHPSIPSDNFSVRWTTTLNATAGNYTFHTCTDDGVRLYVDGRLIIDQWRNMPPTDYYATTYLSAGEHTITMEYYDWQWGAVAQLSWQ